MEQHTAQATSRTHPLVVGASVSVILVSLLGVAALTGLLPISHGSVQPVAAAHATDATAIAASPTPARYVTQDGRVLEVAPSGATVSRGDGSRPAPLVRHKVVHRYTQPSFRDQQGQYAQNTYAEPVRTYEQPAPVLPQHPVQNYVSDMHPVGTGVGAVVGGLLGNQVGGGRGKTLATVAGALLGGYAGNEVAHDRSPIP